MSDEKNPGQGLKSLDTALGVLARLTRLNGPQTLTDIAKECGMSSSKVHRYLASFVQAGLVKQEGRSGRYDIGPEAMQLGMAAIARHDFVNHAADGLPELSAQTGMTVLLSVWANQGATVVRWERGATPTDTSMGLGTTLPLLNSATGRVFLAWGQPRVINPVRDAQLRRLARQPAHLIDVPATKSGLDDLTKRTRARGFASVEGKFIPGLVAVAAPVLDWQNEVQAAVTLVGTDPEAIVPGSEPSETLLAFCDAKSVRRNPAAP